MEIYEFMVSIFIIDGGLGITGMLSLMDNWMLMFDYPDSSKTAHFNLFLVQFKYYMI